MKKYFRFLLLRMNNFVVRLQSKIKVIRSKYDEVLTEGAPLILDGHDAKMFSSMQRWHENSHMSEMDWLTLFNKVKIKLETKENFEPDDSLQTVIKFLKSKFSSNTLVGQYCVSDLFTDHFESCVKSYYLEKIADQNDQLDEFDGNVFKGMKQEDINFYRKTFLPLSVFYTYQEKHQQATSTDMKEILEDLFTIGAGSRRLDLFPEVNAFCQVCCSDLWE